MNQFGESNPQDFKILLRSCSFCLVTFGGNAYIGTYTCANSAFLHIIKTEVNLTLWFCSLVGYDVSFTVHPDKVPGSSPGRTSFCLLHRIARRLSISRGDLFRQREPCWPSPIPQTTFPFCLSTFLHSTALPAEPSTQTPGSLL